MIYELKMPPIKKEKAVSIGRPETGGTSKNYDIDGQILVVAEKVFHSLYGAMILKDMSVALCTFQSAVEFVKTRRVDIAILDSCADGERGLKLLREIKFLSPKTPVIFVTEKAFPDFSREAYRSGARDFMEKPINMNELCRRVGNLFEIIKTSKEKRRPFFPERELSSVEITSYKPNFIIRTIRYMEDNLSSKISLEGIAREANYSKYHFCRMFYRYTGMTPFQFHAVMRIEKSKGLLSHGDIAISQVAEQVGFNDVGPFLRQFKKITGMTPTKYRDRLRR